MQINNPAMEHQTPYYDRSKWTRKRTNHRLLILVSLPLRIARQTHEPWIYTADRQFVYTPNDVWNAAMDESARLKDLYMRKVPLSKWGIEAPPPNDPFWGPLGDPAFRRHLNRTHRRLVDESEMVEIRMSSRADRFIYDAAEAEMDSWDQFVREMREGK